MAILKQIGVATLYLGDCRDILPGIGRVDATVMDPPYGLGDKLDGGSAASRSRWKLTDGGKNTQWDVIDVEAVQLAIEIATHSIVWGGQFYPLPVARCWLIWNKIIRNWKSSEAELAWSTLDKANRAFDYSHGQLANEGKLHPTQKPLPLMKWCVSLLPMAANVILDPFMGSGTTGVAAVHYKRSFIGIERDPDYFDIACRRIEEAQNRTHEDASAKGMLF